MSQARDYAQLVRLPNLPTALADICLGPIVHRCLDFPIELPALPGIRAWRDKITQRPAFKKATG